MVIDTSRLPQITSANTSPASSQIGQSSGGVVANTSSNPPVDDASGLSALAQLDAQTQAAEAASGSVSTAVSFTQTQNGYLQGIAAALGRMSDLAQSAQDPSSTSTDGSARNDEFSGLNSYIEDVAGKAFNGIGLFSGNPLQVTVDGNGTTLSLPGISFSAGGTGASIGTTTAAATALAGVQAGIAQLNSNRATLQSNQVILNNAADQLSVTLSNLDSVNLPITDADGASAAAEAARQMIQSNPATALAAQGGSLQQSAIDLLE